MIWYRLKVLIILFSIFIYSTLAFAMSKNKKNSKVNKIEIKKYSQEVHVIIPFDCSKYNHEFQGMLVMKQPTIDTIIYDNLLMAKIQNAFETFNDFIDNAKECRGNPQIQITIYYKNETKTVFLIQDYYYLINIKDRPVFKNEWSINFLKSLGGFE